MQDGSYWLMPGKGLQDYLTAGDLDEMANEYFIPQAQVGNFQEGIRQLFSACFAKMSIAYNAGVSIDESLYYSWLQSAPAAADGAKFLSTPVRDMPEVIDPVVQPTDVPAAPPAQPDRGEGGIGTLAIVCIAIVVIVIIVRSRRTVRSRPGQHRSAPAPRRPVAPPPPPRPPMGGYSRPAPRPPMNGGMGTRPSGSYSRPASQPVSRPTSSRTPGGFGGNRSAGGGTTRGGGTGGSFRGGR